DAIRGDLVTGVQTCALPISVERLRFVPDPLERPLEWIWHESEAFNRFRGESWMPEPCRSCPRKEMDYGGCRCQAFLVAGDAGVTDTVCSLSPRRHLIDATVAQVERGAAAQATPEQWTYRAAPASRALAAKG